MLLILFFICLFHREEAADVKPPSVALPNPFGTAEGDRR